jgi:hypothetical protein
MHPIDEFLDARKELENVMEEEMVHQNNELLDIEVVKVSRGRPRNTKKNKK